MISLHIYKYPHTYTNRHYIYFLHKLQFHSSSNQMAFCFSHSCFLTAAFSQPTAHSGFCKSHSPTKHTLRRSRWCCGRLEVGNLRKYFFISLRPKIDAILELDTQTNVRYKVTKLPLVFYEKDLDMNLSFVWEPSKVLELLFLLGRREY
jgi:hypothetical protein